uniref:Uncharacterized protein n=1 Tax=Amphimedon queenslandica TaxID=400682 RepID=A0A1X7TNX7_AMPQE
MSSHSEAQCYPLLHSNGSWDGVCNNARATNYLVSDYQDLLNNTGDGGAVFYLPNIELDASDQRTEHVHFQNSAGLLLVLILLSLTILTIWVFKVKRFRVMHETGLSILYGIIIGVVIHYGFPSTPQDEFYLAEKACESSGTVRTFEIGDTVTLQTQGGDGFRCSINSKVFRTREGDRIEEALLFDPELFFFLLLPPIIFYAGYSLQKRHFFRNIGSLLMYAFAELDLKRYKYIVQVVIGEQRGEGVKIGSRCLWDTDTDNYSQGLFINRLWQLVNVNIASTTMTLTPLPLSKDNSFVSPSPEVYVRHALRTLDYRSNCCGYWIHAIINYVYQLVPARLWVWFMSHRNQRVRERQLTVGARERGGVTFSKNRSTVSFAISTTPPDEVYTASEAGQRPELIRNYSRVAVMPSVAEQESNK